MTSSSGGDAYTKDGPFSGDLFSNMLFELAYIVRIGTGNVRCRYGRWSTANNKSLESNLEFISALTSNVPIVTSGRSFFNKKASPFRKNPTDNRSSHQAFDNNRWLYHHFCQERYGGCSSTMSVCSNAGKNYGSSLVNHTGLVLQISVN